MQFAARNNRLGAFRFFEDLGWKTVGEVELADNDLHVHPEIIFITYDLDDPAAWGLGGGRPIGDLNIDDYIFQIVPAIATRSLLAQHPMNRLPRFRLPSA